MTDPFHLNIDTYICIFFVSSYTELLCTKECWQENTTKITDKFCLIQSVEPVTHDTVTCTLHSFGLAILCNGALDKTASPNNALDGVEIILMG